MYFDEMGEKEAKQTVWNNTFTSFVLFSVSGGQNNANLQQLDLTTVLSNF
jgi:hypothetical protein